MIRPIRGLVLVLVLILGSRPRAWMNLGKKSERKHADLISAMQLVPRSRSSSRQPAPGTHVVPSESPGLAQNNVELMSTDPAPSSSLSQQQQPALPALPGHTCSQSGLSFRIRIVCCSSVHNEFNRVCLLLTLPWLPLPPWSCQDLPAFLSLRPNKLLFS